MFIYMHILKFSFDLTGKGDSTKASTLPIRTSPRKRSCVRLFGATQTIEDAPTNTEMPPIRTPQNPANVIMTNDDSGHSKIHGNHV